MVCCSAVRTRTVLRHALSTGTERGRPSCTATVNGRSSSSLLDGETAAHQNGPATSAMNPRFRILDCGESRQSTVANPDVMHRSMSTVHAANICMWLKRDLRYDPVSEEFIGDAEANRLRNCAERDPWIYYMPTLEGDPEHAEQRS